MLECARVRICSTYLVQCYVQNLVHTLLKALSQAPRLLLDRGHKTFDEGDTFRAGGVNVGWQLRSPMLIVLACLFVISFDN